MSWFKKKKESEYGNESLIHNSNRFTLCLPYFQSDLFLTKLSLYFISFFNSNLR